MSKLVRGQGKADAQVMVVGAHPGAEESKSGKPFSGELGAIVRGTLSSVTDSVYYTYLSKHCPDGRMTPADVDLAALDRELSSVRPDVIVCCGGFVTRHFLGVRSVAKVRGMVASRQHTGLNRPVKYLPIYDLGHVMRRGGLSSRIGLDWIADIEELRHVL